MVNYSSYIGFIIAIGFLSLVPQDSWPQATPEQEQKKLEAAYQKAEKLAEQGKAAEAILYYDKALALAPRVFGPRHLNTGKLMNNLAQVCREAKQYTRAESLSLSSLKILEANLGKNHLDLAAAYGVLAGIYHATEEYIKAVPALEKCRAILEVKAKKDDPRLAVTLMNLAWLYQDLKDHARAEPLWKRTLKIYEARGGPDGPNVAHILGHLAKLYQDTEQYPRAEALYLRAIKIVEVRQGKTDPQVGAILSHLSILYELTGRPAQAEAANRRCLQIAEATFGKGSLELATILNNLALATDQVGEYSRAEALYLRSLKIKETRLGKHDPRIATTLANLADLCRKMGQYDRAQRLARRAVQIVETRVRKDSLQATYPLSTLALVFEARGQYDRAEPLLVRCLKILEAKRGRDHPLTGAALANLAMLCNQLGQFPKAESLARRSLQIAEDRLGREHPQVASALNNLATVYYTAGQYDRIEPLLKRCMTIQESRLGKDHPNVARSLNNLAELYRVQGKDTRARSCYERSLAMYEARMGKDHPEVANCLQNLAVLNMAMKNYARAEKLLARALTIGKAKLGRDSPEVARSLNHLAAVYAATKRWDKATRTFDEGRRLMCRHARRILPGLSEPEQLLFLRKQEQPAFHAALSLGLNRRREPGMAALAAEWVLNGKAVSWQVLAENSLLARSGTDPRLAHTSEELAKVRAQLARLTVHGPRRGLEEQHLQDLARLTRQEEELAKQLGQGSGRINSWYKLDEVRKALPVDAVLIEVVRFDVMNYQRRDGKLVQEAPRFAAWVIPGKGQGDVALIDLGPADRIEEAVMAGRKALHDAAHALGQGSERVVEQRTIKPLQRLARLVLEPLQERIQAKGHWILSPDASLWLVPWAALPLADGSYAIEKHRLSYVLSGRDLLSTSRKLDCAPPAIFADPDFDREPSQGEQADSPLRGLRGLTSMEALPRFHRLAGSAAEAKAVAPLLKRYSGAKPEVYTGKEALEGEFKRLKRPRVLLLSTHGFFLEDQEGSIIPTPLDIMHRGLKLVELNPAHPMKKNVKVLENPLLRCGLALAGANQRHQASQGADDGILTGLEIVGTDLRGTELVVLSACETGLGQVRNGEGVAGLRQAFQLAGAQSVVATLWQIPDKETTALMTAFFEKLAQKKGKAEALRLAQLEIIKQRRVKHKAAHPFYWAAFTLTGQWQ